MTSSYRLPANAGLWSHERVSWREHMSSPLRPFVKKSPTCGARRKTHPSAELGTLQRARVLRLTAVVAEWYATTIFVILLLFLPLPHVEVSP